MKILGIESSCDETAAAVIKNGREVCSNVIFSQIELHKLYGGVVPEIASRKHIEAIYPLADEAIKTAGLTKKDIDAVAKVRVLTEKDITVDKNGKLCSF